MSSILPIAAVRFPVHTRCTEREAGVAKAPSRLIFRRLKVLKTTFKSGVCFLLVCVWPSFHFHCVLGGLSPKTPYFGNLPLDCETVTEGTSPLLKLGFFGKISVLRPVALNLLELQPGFWFMGNNYLELELGINCSGKIVKKTEHCKETAYLGHTHVSIPSQVCRNKTGPAFCRPYSLCAWKCSVVLVRSGEGSRRGARLLPRQ